MKIGDLVKYYGGWTQVGLLLKIKKTGELLVYHNGKFKWWVTSGCEVISESR